MALIRKQIRLTIEETFMFAQNSMFEVIDKFQNQNAFEVVDASFSIEFYNEDADFRTSTDKGELEISFANLSSQRLGDNVIQPVDFDTSFSSDNAILVSNSYVKGLAGSRGEIYFRYYISQIKLLQLFAGAVQNGDSLSYKLNLYLVLNVDLNS
jgi:hypothetical protein